MPTENDTSPNPNTTDYVQRRIALERSIVRRTILAMNSIGVECSIRGVALTTSRESLDEVVATDEARMGLTADGKRIGSVLFVFGNTGWDTIADWSAPENVSNELENIVDWAAEQTI